jgi:hypothetical protein
MIRRMRDGSGRWTSRVAAEAAVLRGMADVLAALDHVIDDDAALGHMYAGLGTSVPEPAVATARACGPAPSRQRLPLRPMAGIAAVLTVAAVALVAVVVPGASQQSTGGPAVSTAYVVKRVSSALSAAEPGAIAQMTVTTRGGGIPGGTTAATAAEEWSYGDQWRSATSSLSGQPDYDEGSGTASLYTLVSYLTRTWARERVADLPAPSLSGSPGCGPAVAGLPTLLVPGLPGIGLPASSPPTVARNLRAAVSCGSLAEAGPQRVDGIETTKLTSSPDSVISETIWVSPGTYLPVRVVIRPAPGQPGLWQQADITWLKPTAQNLAQLAVPVPAGFRQVPLAQAIAPLMQHTAVQAAP